MRFFFAIFCCLILFSLEQANAVLEPNTPYPNITKDNSVVLTDYDLSNSSEYFQNSFVWTLDTKNGKQSIDEQSYIIGESSLLIETEGNSLPVIIASPLLKYPLNLENRLLNSWIKINDPSKIKELSFILISDSFENSWSTFDYTSEVKKLTPGQWEYVQIPINDFHKTGNPSHSSINKIQIKITDLGNEPIRINLNEISFGTTDFSFNYLSDSNCNCVAFRLDDVQDYWLNDVQLEILKTFEDEKTPLTIGVIGKFFGDDQKIVNHLKNQISTSYIDVANHGWEHESFIDFDLKSQKQIISQTNEKIEKILNYTVVSFIPPFNDYDSNTLYALADSKINYLSSEIDKSLPSTESEVDRVYNFPETAFSGDLNVERNQFVGMSSFVTFNQIELAQKNYGYAVVTIHPQEFSMFVNGTYVNEINPKQIEHLKSLIHSVKNSDMKIVLIKDIRNNISYNTEIPSWVKNNARWWLEEKIDDATFIQGLEYLIQKEIISIPKDPQKSQINSKISAELKQNAGWWVQGLLPDSEFITDIQYLINLNGSMMSYTRD